VSLGSLINYLDHRIACDDATALCYVTLHSKLLRRLKVQVLFFAETFQSFFAETFWSLKHFVTCLTVALKYAITVFLAYIFKHFV